MTSVVVVGSVNADLIARTDRLPERGETVLAGGMDVLPGGKGANQAVAAALLGADVALVGAVGSDAFADLATTGLRDAGVDLGALARVAGPTGIALVTVAPEGDNTIVVVPGANAAVDAAAVAAHADLVAGADVVVLQGEIPRGGTEAAARTARGRVLLNLAPAVELDPEVLRLADPLVVNEHEARLAMLVLGEPVVPPSGDGAVAARALLDAGVRSVVVTLGAAGAVLGQRSPDAPDVVGVPAPRVTAVDTTGAGDALVGALAARLAAGDQLVEAARFAVRVATSAVTAVGAQPSYPRADDPLP